MGAIDVWAQITTERMVRRPWMQTLLRWTGRSEESTETVETTLRAMDAGGVDIAILSAWHGPEGSLISNEEVARMIEAAPTRFRVSRRLISIGRWNWFGKFGAGSIANPSWEFASCRGCGACRPTTDVITLFTPPASTRACLSALRSVTQDRFGDRKQDDPSPDPKTSYLIFRSLSLSADMSAFHGSTNS